MSTRRRNRLLTSALLLLGLLTPLSLVSTASPATAACSAAPTYSGSKTLFGAYVLPSGGFSSSVSKANSKFGTLKAIRIFNNGMVSSNFWSGHPMGSAAAVVSFKGTPSSVSGGSYDSQLKNFFNDAPTNVPVFWTYYHEVDGAVAHGKLTVSAFKSAWAHIASIAASACRTNVYPTLILTGYATESGSGRNWQDYYPGDSTTSVVAFDPYNNANGRPSSYPDPSSLFASVVKVGKATGKPWGIAETGSGLVSGDSGSGRAAWLTKMGQYFHDQGAKFVTYYDSDTKCGCSLDDTPSINAWKAWVNS